MISILEPIDQTPHRKSPSRGSADPVLSILSIGLAAFGVVMVYSATRGPDGDASFALRQIGFLVISIVAMFSVGRLDYRRLRPRALLIVLVTMFVLVLVLSPLGSEVRGTKGWLRIGSLALQPAEMAKVAVIIAVAALMTSRDRILARVSFIIVRVGGSLVLLAVIGAMVLAGGETGTVLVYAAAAVGIFVLAGVPKRMLGLLAISAVMGIGWIINAGVLEPYQQDRIEAFVDLDADPLGSGYNQRQSLTAIGSGGLTGKGLFNGPQTQLRYLPEQQTDFIFAVVSEELGFLGAVGLLIGEGLILLRVLRVAVSTTDPFGALICGGVFSYLVFQVFQNVAMNVRLLPVAGLPLPFVSYGGSALVTSFVALGLVHSVAAWSDETARQGRSRFDGQQFWALTNCDIGRASSGRVR